MGTFCCCCCLFVFSRATPMAYGGPQDRGPVRAGAVSLYHSHSNVGSKPHLRPTPQQCQILNPLSEARDQTHVLMDTSWVCYHWTMTGTPFFLILFFCLFRAAPMAQGSSQARGGIRAVATTLCHSHSNVNLLTFESGCEDHCSDWKGSSLEEPTIHGQRKERKCLWKKEWFTGRIPHVKLPRTQHSILRAGDVIWRHNQEW